MRALTAMMILCAVPTLADAPPAHYCEPALSVRSRIVWCHENSFYVNSATECEAKLKRDIDEASRVLGADFSRLLLSNAGAQRDNQKNAISDFGDTSGKLTMLIGKAAAAQADIRSYVQNLIFLRNFSQEFLASAGLLSEHQLTPCYHDNYLALGKLLDEVTARKSQLEVAEAEVKRKSGISTGRKAGLDLDPAGPRAAVAKGRSPASVPVPAGRSRKSQSDITGVKPEGVKP